MPTAFCIIKIVRHRKRVNAPNEKQSGVYMDLRKIFSRENMKKLPWGTFAAISTIAAVLLTAGFFGLWFVLNAIAGQTHSTAGPFGQVYQVLVFVFAILFIAAAVFSFVEYFIFREEKQTSKAWILKVFSKSFWGIWTGFFAVFFIAFTVGQTMTVNNSSFINEFLGVTEYKKVQSDTAEVFNEYRSDFVNEDGSFNDAAMRNYSLDVATRVATEGTVLLSNKNDALPLKKDSKISFFGISSARYLFSGSGSGHLTVSVTSNLLKSCKANSISVNPSLANAYKMLSATYGNYQTEAGKTISGSSVGDSCYVEYVINEAPWKELNKTSIGKVENTFSEYGDAAVMIISRNDGEDGDTNYDTPECIDGNYLDLAFEEVDILNKLIALKKTGVFKKVILVINAANPMQMKNISKLDLDACIWAGIGGNVSFDQIALVLSGKANPSGRLIDTYVYDNYSSPASVNMGDFSFKTTSGLPSTEKYAHNDKYLVYSEGIYVGYRYYETRYEDKVLGVGNAGDYDYKSVVAYPFGYGKSYTTFEKSKFSVRETSEGYEVKVTVKNTGTVAGKETVQVYLQKPYTDYDKDNNIEKAAAELCGYAKTKELKAGESVEVKIFVSKEELKTYDAYGEKTYILEAGDYYLSVGDNAHDALNNVLAKKGKSVSDGMDYNGNADFVQKLVVKKTDTKTYSKSVSTGYEITNRFDESDPTVYEGTKEQFKSFKYLSRKDWTATYPKPAVMDCLTKKMADDMQYTKEVTPREGDVMPKFGVAGTAKLLDLWGLDYDAPEWDSLLDQLTWDEAVSLVTKGGGTGGAVSVGAPGSEGKDGPGGIGVANANLPNVMCFPSECLMAATFNDELIEELGNAFGMEILHVGGYAGIYGPGANIHRSAFSGRNFEYYSEDPFISGKMLAREVKGLQSRGVIVFTKHFALNDEERNRYGVSVWANEQSIREIYLKPFETGVREGGMNGIMSSFNRIGTAWSGKHGGLLTEVLRNEWGFLGVVQTDAYVGTHMHRALAESIVAGNDFTMGGANPRALDSYKNNATVGKALRDCSHRILYTQLHSLAMNGLSVDYRIVYQKAWWRVAIDDGRIIAGLLSVAGFAMLIASFFVVYGVNKKKRLVELRLQTAMNESVDGVVKDPAPVRYFFDVFPKSFTAITASVIAVAVIASIIIPVAVAAGNVVRHECTSVCSVCGGCQNFDCKEKACEKKCSCKRLCEHACSTCGLCLDPTSTAELCKEKCGSDLTKAQRLEAEDDHTYKFAGNRGGLAVVQEPDSSLKYVANMNENGGSAVKFVIESAEESKGGLIVSVSKQPPALLYTNSVLVTVNGKTMESRGFVPGLTNGEAQWVTFTEVNLGCIELKKGRNVIEFTMINSENSKGFNFDAITVKSNTDISWYEGAHICDHVCAECGLCRQAQCPDPVCKAKCYCNIEKTEYNLSDGKATADGLTVTNGVAIFTNANQKLEYVIKSTTQTSAVLCVNAKTDVKNLKASDAFALLLNGKKLAVGDEVIGGDYDYVTLASVTLPYGKNKIEIVALGSNAISAKGLVIGCNEELTYADANEFLTTDDRVYVSGNARKSSEYCIAMNENCKGSVITFPICSSKATNADLYFNIASRPTSAKIADILKIKVNGTEVFTDADLPTEGREWFTYNDVFLSNISLKSGINEITFEVLTNNQSINTNLRSIIFKNCDAQLDWADSAASNFVLKIEAEDTILGQSSQGKPYVKEGENASNDKYLGGVNEAGLFTPGEATITFKVNASEEETVGLYFGAGVMGSARASAYAITVNGEPYSSELSWSGGGWCDWKAWYWGAIKLKKGENVIVIRINEGCQINIDYFRIESMSKIDFVKE